MATLTAPVVTVLSKAFTGGTNQGQASGFVPATTGGDMFPISGQGILLTYRTAGTAITVTINSVALSSYGDDKDITMVLAATDEQEVFIKNDGRFDQGGVNAGLVAVTYSGAITTQTVKAKTIPGLA
jgi:hypothetical protein